MRPPVDLSGMRTVLARVGLKELPFYPRDEMLSSALLPRSHYNYGHDIGDGLRSNVIMAPIMWIMRVFTEARAIVQSKRGKGVWDDVDGHELERLIHEPNPFYSGDALWKSTIISYILDGNGFWIKVRNAFGDVVQLWYAPHWLMKPRWFPQSTAFIDHWEYTPGGETIRLAPRDVVHFKFGNDPRDPRLGLGSLKPLLREVFIDEEAATFASTLLVNNAVPGLVISPKERLTVDQAEAFKKQTDAATGGANRGGTFIPTWPVDTKQSGFDPNQMMLGNLRDISEERVCALIGIPAAVVGFGSGLQSTKVGATMRELMKAAWTTCIIPMQKSFAEQLTTQLLPDFVAQTRQFRAVFDTSEVSAFQEDKDATVKRAAEAVLAGMLRIDRAQEMCGFEVDPKRAIYLTPSGTEPVDKSGKPIEMPSDRKPDAPDEGEDEDDIPPAVAARRNGNGSNPNEE